MRANTTPFAGLAVLLAFSGTNEARAQSSGNTAPAEPAAQAGEVSEVFVTARRVREKLSEAPVSGTVVGAAELSTLVIDRFDDLARQIPSVTILNTGADYLSDITIRGQGAGRSGFNESATGIYRNGVFVAGGGFGGRTLNMLDLFDAERVEAFRGPQAALFGRNASGGAINVVSARPNAGRTNAQMEAGYDERDRFRFSAIGNTPLIDDRLAIRGAVILVDQRDGFYKDAATGEATDQTKFFGLRGSASWLVSPGWSATLTLERSENQAPANSSLGRHTDTAGRNDRFDPSRYVRVASRFGRTKIEDSTAFLELKGDLGLADLSLVATRRLRDARLRNEDLDHQAGWEGIGLADFSGSQDEDFERFGLEGVLSSKISPDARWRWLLGADVSRYDDKVITTNTGTRANTTGLNPVQLAALNLTPALLPQFIAFANLNSRTDRSRDELKSWSAFGLVEVEATERLSISLEGRRQSDEKDYTIARVVGVPPVAERQVTDSYSAWVGALSLNYQVAPEHRIYARLANGVRPGGFNIGGASLNDIAYQPERSTTGEVGWKGRLGARIRGSVSAYYSHTDDLQQQQLVDPINNVNSLGNVNAANFYGLEIEASGLFRVGPGRLSLRASAATNYGEYADGTLILLNQGVFDLSGHRVPRNRDYTVSALARYGWPAWGGQAFASVNGQFEGGGYENPQGSLKTTLIPNARSLASINRIDLRAGWENRTWRISAYAQNAGDSVVVLTSIAGNEFYSSPRVVGVEFTYRFGE